MLLVSLETVSLYGILASQFIPSIQVLYACDVRSRHCEEIDSGFGLSSCGDV